MHSQLFDGRLDTPVTEDENSSVIRNSTAQLEMVSSHLPSSWMTVQSNELSAERATQPMRGNTPLSKQDFSGRSKSPLDSFLDFYESIPDYQEVTHLTDEEFHKKVKLLRKKQKQYIDSLGGRYSISDSKANHKSNYKKSDYKPVNKLELAKEWVNKSCDSLNSAGKKSESDCQFTPDGSHLQPLRSSVKSSSARNTNACCLKEDVVTDSGSSLSADSAMQKLARSRSSCALLSCKPTSQTVTSRSRDFSELIVNKSAMRNAKSLTNFCNVKEEVNKWQALPQQRESNHTFFREKKSKAASDTNIFRVAESNSSLTDGCFEDMYLPMSSTIISETDSTLFPTPSFNKFMYNSLPSSPTYKQNKNATWREKGPKKDKRKYRKSSSKADLRSGSSNSPFHLHGSNIFRAKPIPRNLFTNYNQKRKEDQFYKALKKKIRSEEMLRGASLPPSMEFRERLQRVQREAEVAAAVDSPINQPSLRERKQERGRQGIRFRSQSAFNSCSQKQRQQVREKQGSSFTSSPSPYSSQTSSLSPSRKRVQRSPCSDVSRSNLAALLRIQSARQRLEEEHARLCQEQRRRADNKLKARLTRLTPAWRNIQYSTEEDLALRAATRREHERLRRAQHVMLMRNMLDRVMSIPTLFERQSAQGSKTCSERATPSLTVCKELLNQCDNNLDLQLDNDDIDVSVLAPSRPSRPRSRNASTKSRSISPRKEVQSPDQMSNRLRNFHRNLPHKVEFKDNCNKPSGGGRKVKRNITISSRSEHDEQQRSKDNNEINLLVSHK